MKKNMVTKQVVMMIITTALIVSGCERSNSTTNAALDGELKVAENQAVVIAQVSSIRGNEVTLALAQEVERGSMQNNRDNKNNVESSGELPETKDPSQQSNKKGQMPANDTSEEGSMAGGVTSGGTTSGRGEKPSGDVPQSGGDMPQTQAMYMMTGEEKTMLIPVGTPVITLLGTTSTFSRIAVENTVKVVVENNELGEEVIVAVYIVG